MYFTILPNAIKNLILRKTGKMTEAKLQRLFFGYLTQIDEFNTNIQLK